MESGSVALYAGFGRLAVLVLSVASLGRRICGVQLCGLHVFPRSWKKRTAVESTVKRHGRCAVAKRWKSHALWRTRANGLSNTKERDRRPIICEDEVVSRSRPASTADVRIPNSTALPFFCDIYKSLGQYRRRSESSKMRRSFAAFPAGTNPGGKLLLIALLLFCIASGCFAQSADSGSGSGIGSGSGSGEVSNISPSLSLIQSTLLRPTVALSTENVFSVTVSVTPLLSTPSSSHLLGESGSGSGTGSDESVSQSQPLSLSIPTSEVADGSGSGLGSVTTATRIVDIPTSMLPPPSTADSSPVRSMQLSQSFTAMFSVPAPTMPIPASVTPLQAHVSSMSLADGSGSGSGNAESTVPFPTLVVSTISTDVLRSSSELASSTIQPVSTATVSSFPISITQPADLGSGSGSGERSTVVSSSVPTPVSPTPVTPSIISSALEMGSGESGIHMPSSSSALTFIPIMTASLTITPPLVAGSSSPVLTSSSVPGFDSGSGSGERASPSPASSTLTALSTTAGIGEETLSTPVSSSTSDIGSGLGSGEVTSPILSSVPTPVSPTLMNSALTSSMVAASDDIPTTAVSSSTADVGSGSGSGPVTLTLSPRASLTLSTASAIVTTRIATPHASGLFTSSAMDVGSGSGEAATSIMSSVPIPVSPTLIMSPPDSTVAVQMSSMPILSSSSAGVGFGSGSGESPVVSSSSFSLQTPPAISSSISSVLASREEVSSVLPSSMVTEIGSGSGSGSEGTSAISSTRMPVSSMAVRTSAAIMSSSSPIALSMSVQTPVILSSSSADVGSGSGSRESIVVSSSSLPLQTPPAISSSISSVLASREEVSSVLPSSMVTEIGSGSGSGSEGTSAISSTRMLVSSTAARTSAVITSFSSPIALSTSVQTPVILSSSSADVGSGSGSGESIVVSSSSLPLQTPPAISSSISSLLASREEVPSVLPSSMVTEIGSGSGSGSEGTSAISSTRMFVSSTAVRTSAAIMSSGAMALSTSVQTPAMTADIESGSGSGDIRFSTPLGSLPLRVSPSTVALMSLASSSPGTADGLSSFIGTTLTVTSTMSPPPESGSGSGSGAGEVPVTSSALSSPVPPVPTSMPGPPPIITSSQTATLVLSTIPAVFSTSLTSIELSPSSLSLPVSIPSTIVASDIEGSGSGSGDMSSATLVSGVSAPPISSVMPATSVSSAIGEPESGSGSGQTMRVTIPQSSVEINPSSRAHQSSTLTAGSSVLVTSPIAISSSAAPLVDDSGSGSGSGQSTLVSDTSMSSTGFLSMSSSTVSPTLPITQLSTLTFSQSSAVLPSTSTLVDDIGSGSGFRTSDIPITTSTTTSMIGDFSSAVATSIFKVQSTVSGVVMPTTFFPSPSVVEGSGGGSGGEQVSLVTSTRLETLTSAFQSDSLESARISIALETSLLLFSTTIAMPTRSPVSTATAVLEESSSGSGSGRDPQSTSTALLQTSFRSTQTLISTHLSTPATLDPSFSTSVLLLATTVVSSEFSTQTPDNIDGSGSGIASSEQVFSSIPVLSSSVLGHGETASTLLSSVVTSTSFLDLPPEPTIPSVFSMTPMPSSLVSTVVESPASSQMVSSSLFGDPTGSGFEGSGSGDVSSTARSSTSEPLLSSTQPAVTPTPVSVASALPNTADPIQTSPVATTSSDAGSGVDSGFETSEISVFMSTFTFAVGLPDPFSTPSSGFVVASSVTLISGPSSTFQMPMPSQSRPTAVPSSAMAVAPVVSSSLTTVLFDVSGSGSGSGSDSILTSDVPATNEPFTSSSSEIATTSARLASTSVPVTSHFVIITSSLAGSQSTSLQLPPQASDGLVFETVGTETSVIPSSPVVLSTVLHESSVPALTSTVLMLPSGGGSGGGSGDEISTLSTPKPFATSSLSPSLASFGFSTTAIVDLIPATSSELLLLPATSVGTSTLVPTTTPLPTDTSVLPEFTSLLEVPSSTVDPTFGVQPPSPSDGPVATLTMTSTDFLALPDFSSSPSAAPVASTPAPDVVSQMSLASSSVTESLVDPAFTSVALPTSTSMLGTLPDPSSVVLTSSAVSTSELQVSALPPFRSSTSSIVPLPSVMMSLATSTFVAVDTTDTTSMQLATPFSSAATSPSPRTSIEFGGAFTSVSQMSSVLSTSGTLSFSSNIASIALPSALPITSSIATRTSIIVSSSLAASEAPTPVSIMSSPVSSIVGTSQLPVKPSIFSTVLPPLDAGTSFVLTASTETTATSQIASVMLPLSTTIPTAPTELVTTTPVATEPRPTEPVPTEPPVVIGEEFWVALRIEFPTDNVERLSLGYGQPTYNREKEDQLVTAYLEALVTEPGRKKRDVARLRVKRQAATTVNVTRTLLSSSVAFGDVAFYVSQNGEPVAAAMVVTLLGTTLPRARLNMITQSTVVGVFTFLERPAFSDEQGGSGSSSTVLPAWAIFLIALAGILLVVSGVLLFIKKNSRKKRFDMVKAALAADKEAGDPGRATGAYRSKGWRTGARSSMAERSNSQESIESETATFLNNPAIQQLQKEPRALPGMQDDDDEMLEEPSPLATRRHVSMVEAARGKTVAEVHYLPPLAGDELIDPKDVDEPRRTSAESPVGSGIVLANLQHAMSLSASPTLPGQDQTSLGEANKASSVQMMQTTSPMPAPESDIFNFTNPIMKDVGEDMVFANFSQSEREPLPTMGERETEAAEEVPGEDAAEIPEMKMQRKLSETVQAETIRNKRRLQERTRRPETEESARQRLEEQSKNALQLRKERWAEHRATSAARLEAQQQLAERRGELPNNVEAGQPIPPAKRSKHRERRLKKFSSKVQPLDNSDIFYTHEVTKPKKSASRIAAAGFTPQDRSPGKNLALSPQTTGKQPDQEGAAPRQQKSSIDAAKVARAMHASVDPRTRQQQAALRDLGMVTDECEPAITSYKRLDVEQEADPGRVPTLEQGGVPAESDITSADDTPHRHLRPLPSHHSEDLGSELKHTMSSAHVQMHQLLDDAFGLLSRRISRKGAVAPMDGSASEASTSSTPRHQKRSREVEHLAEAMVPILANTMTKEERMSLFGAGGRQKSFAWSETGDRAKTSVKEEDLNRTKSVFVTPAQNLPVATESSDSSSADSTSDGDSDARHNLQATRSAKQVPAARKKGVPMLGAPRSLSASAPSASFSKHGATLRPLQPPRVVPSSPRGVQKQQRQRQVNQAFASIRGPSLAPTHPPFTGATPRLLFTASTTPVPDPPPGDSTRPQLTHEDSVDHPTARASASAAPSSNPVLGSSLGSAYATTPGSVDTPTGALKLTPVKITKDPQGRDVFTTLPAQGYSPIVPSPPHESLQGQSAQGGYAPAFASQMTSHAHLNVGQARHGANLSQSAPSHFLSHQQQPIPPIPPPAVPGGQPYRPNVAPPGGQSYRLNVAPPGGQSYRPNVAPLGPTAAVSPQPAREQRQSHGPLVDAIRLELLRLSAKPSIASQPPPP